MGGGLETMCVGESGSPDWDRAGLVDVIGGWKACAPPASFMSFRLVGSGTSPAVWGCCCRVRCGRLLSVNLGGFSRRRANCRDTWEGADCFDTCVGADCFDTREILLIVAA